MTDAAAATRVGHAPRIYWRALVPLLVGVAVAATPVPAGLTTEAWRYFAVFLAVIVALITEPIPGALALSYTLGLMGIITPYATGSAPLYYGSGYISHRDFWMLGLLFGVLYLVAILVLEVPYLLLLYR